MVEICGIINITPDSFSESERLYDGKNIKMDRVLSITEKMISDGASVIDIGGESTRPGATEVTDVEEIYRIAPVIEKVKEHFNITVSADTYKVSTAKAAIKAGADIINDIGMMRGDMAKVIAESGKKYVLVHNKENYVNLIDDMQNAVSMALRAGIARDNLILDPGIGFNKSYEQNVAEIRNVEELCKLAYPVLLGVSNKSVIGNTLNLPVDERLEGTLAVSVYAALKGVKYIRVHDVAANVRAVRMIERIML